MEYEVVENNKKEKESSYFDGNFFEYIGYKLLAFIISVLTLTIAKPWGEKLVLQYKYEHTVYNGKRLVFTGTGSSLFVQRLKWLFFTIITLGIYSFWIPLKMEQWVDSNIYFEDEKLIHGDSYFDGKFLGMLGINLFTYLLIAFSFGLLLPFAICYKESWITKHMVINKKKIVFDGNPSTLYLKYILWYVLSFITFGIYGIWTPMKVYSWRVSNTHIKVKNEKIKTLKKLPILIGTIIIILLSIIIFNALDSLNISFDTIKEFIKNSGDINAPFKLIKDLRK